MMWVEMKRFIIVVGFLLSGATIWGQECPDGFTAYYYRYYSSDARFKSETICLRPAVDGEIGTYYVNQMSVCWDSEGEGCQYADCQQGTCSLSSPQWVWSTDYNVGGSAYVPVGVFPLGDTIMLFVLLSSLYGLYIYRKKKRSRILS
jgi:hypothetical protein